jgi:hypothetical protein
LFFDQNEPPESTVISFLVLTAGMLGHVLAALSIVFYTSSRTGFELARWRRGEASQQEAALERARTKGGRGKQAGDSAATVDRAGDGGPLPRYTTAFDPKMTRSLMRKYKIARYSMLVLSTFLGFLTIVSVFYACVVGQWVLLGLYLNPQVAAVWAAGLTGVLFHIIRLRALLMGQYDKVLNIVKTGVARFKNAANRAERLRVAQSAGFKDASWPPPRSAADGAGIDGYDDEGTLQSPRTLAEAALPGGADVVVYPDDITDAELRPLLSRRGISMRVIVLSILSSTLLIICVLAFLVIGIYAATDPQDDVASILGAGMSLISVAGVSFAKGPQVDDLHLKQLAARIVNDFERAQDKNRLTFDAKDSALAVISKADELFG